MSKADKKLDDLLNKKDMDNMNLDQMDKLMKEIEKIGGDDKSSSKKDNEMVWTPWGEMLVTKSQFDKERDILDPRLSQLTKMAPGGNNPLTGNPVLGAMGMGGAPGNPFAHSQLYKMGMQQGMMGMQGMQQQPPFIVVEESDESSDESYDRRRRKQEKRHLRRAMRSAYYSGRANQPWGAVAPMWIDRSY